MRRASALRAALPILLSCGLLVAQEGPAPPPSPAPAAPQSPAPAVRFVTPVDGAIIAGRTEIVVELSPAIAPQARQVEFLINGRQVALLGAPPWRLIQDVGPDFDARVLRAVARGADGVLGEAVIRTRAFRANEVSTVKLVNVFATVRDRRGRYVMDLPKEAFFLREDGKPQTLTHFSQARLPLTVLVVLDTSLSMVQENRIHHARRAAADFVDALEPVDEVGVLGFNTTAQELVAPTTDHDQARRAIAGVVPKGGTALYDAVAQAADRLRRTPEGRRRAIVLLSDGRDEAESGLSPGSVLTFEESFAEAVRAEVILYSIGLGRNLAMEPDFFGRLSLAQVLTRLAEETGGQALFATKAERLGGAYDEIAEDLRHHYSLAYDSTNRRQDGAWRTITLDLREPGLTVRTRKGYFAPGAPATPGAR